MKIEKAYTTHFDIEQLAAKILGLDYEAIDADTQIIEDKLEEEFYIDLEVFQEMVSRLLPLISIAKGIDDQIYKGFVNKDERIWLTKIALDEHKLKRR